jgi:adenosylcobinamide-phosphate synthase
VVGEVAFAVAAPMLGPNAYALIVAVALDLVFGDPVYRAHPVRLVGRSLEGVEKRVRAVGTTGYIGGILLFLALAIVWTGGLSLVIVLLFRIAAPVGWAAHVFLLYSLLALGDLLHHGWRIESALRRDDLESARAAVSHLVGRDTAVMNAAACRRAAVESLSENLTDGFTSPLFWYAVGGLPGIVLFKVISTMDSMVGYKTERYLQFGWCGARLDDVFNYVPARLTWLLIAGVAVLLPRCSGPKALRMGLTQHQVLPGPNSGWSEAATAGGIQRRLVGPLWLNGRLVTETWLGDPGDPPMENQRDYETARQLIVTSGVVAAAAAFIVLIAR